MKISLSLVLLFTSSFEGSYVEIHGPSTIELPYYQNNGEKELLNLFDIEGKVLRYSFSPHPLFAKVGKQNLTLRVENGSYYDIKNFTLKIFDDIPPFIDGPSSFTFSKNHLPSSETLLSYYHAYDEIDHEVNVSIRESDYSFDVGKGSYFISLYATDKAKNIGEKVINIEVVEQIKSIYFNQNQELNLALNQAYSAYQIVALLIKNHLLEPLEIQQATFENQDALVRFNRLGRFPLSMHVKINDEDHLLSFYVLIKDQKENGSSLFSRIIQKILSWIERILK